MTRVLLLVTTFCLLLPLFVQGQHVKSVTKAWWNGLNVPWNNFGYDIGTGEFNSTWFKTFFTTCKNNHVNSARFWVHCDGRGSPSFAKDGSVSGLSSTFLSDIKALATIAKENEVVLLLSLWSFDMFKGGAPNGLHPDLVTDVSKTQSYIDNALVPMINALNGFDNIVYEVMNEPEWGIKGPGNTKVQVPLIDMQRFHSMIAEAVHVHSSAAVTTGSACLKWNSAAIPPAEANYWNDTALTSAYKSEKGTLDFYQVHYYDWMHNAQWGYDPCRENTSYWKLDKPTLVGELPSDAGNFYTPQKFMDCAFENDFIGSMFWSYNSDWPWTDAQAALNGFYNAHSDISSYNVLINWLKAL